ncbi:MAG: Co2+/Mg2+ efflux protein ApaG [Bacteroidota bacterium]
MSTQPSSQTTNGIRVSVRTAYIKDESSPARNEYVFAYQIEIHNESPHVVQLLSREWYIIDAFGSKRKVKGPGVVGKQPVIHPGKSHSYVSGVNFNSPAGKMYGYYTMRRQIDGSTFLVSIPDFTMLAPVIMN